MVRPLFSLVLMLTALGISASTAFSQAQQPPQNGGQNGGQNGNQNQGAGNLNNAAMPIFRAKMPGGTYEVATRAMIAVSTHEYLVDGIARVTELNIDTSSAILVRFYYLEPATPQSPIGLGTATIEKTQQLLTEASERTGQDVWKKVTKSYPTTTHARTVEYRVESKEQLMKIFEAAEEAFRLQRPKNVTVE